MIYPFPPYQDLRMFSVAYKDDVVDWSALLVSNVQLEQIWYDTERGSPFVLEYPWYDKGTWLREPKVRKIVKFGIGKTSPVVVRAPAVRYTTEGAKVAPILMLLDRCHRISELKPKIVILDTLVLKTRAHRRMFGDLV